MNTGVTQVTTTSNVQVDTLLCMSVTVTVTCVVPSGKNVPLAWLYTVDNTPQLSPVVAVPYVTNAPATLLTVVVAVVVTLAGQTTDGGSLSVTVTVKLLVDVLPAASLAV